MAIGISRAAMDLDVEEALKGLPGEVKTAVDLGCGVGKLGRIAKSIFPAMKVTGVDGNPDIIEHLKGGDHPYDELQFALIQDALSQLPSSDLIVAGDVLEHLPADVLVEVTNRIREKCKYALIVGPEQKEEDLERSASLRSDLPALEHHLSLLRGEALAEKLGKTLWLSRKNTTNSLGENPYDKFCLLVECG